MSKHEQGHHQQKKKPAKQKNDAQKCHELRMKHQEAARKLHITYGQYITLLHAGVKPEDYFKIE